MKTAANLLTCDPRNFLVCIILILLGLVTLGGGLIGVQATPTSEVRWITAFATLPEWFGWLLILCGVDSLFGGRLMVLLVSKILSSPLKFIAKSIVGEERLSRLQAKLTSKSNVEKWVRKTYGNVLDEETVSELVLIAELKAESPELYNYFRQGCADKMRHEGITEEMIEKTAEHLEVKQ